MVTPFIFNNLGNRIADREWQAGENLPFPCQNPLIAAAGWPERPD